MVRATRACQTCGTRYVAMDAADRTDRKCPNYPHSPEQAALEADIASASLEELEAAAAKWDQLTMEEQRALLNTTAARLEAVTEALEPLLLATRKAMDHALDALMNFMEHPHMKALLGAAKKLEKENDSGPKRRI